MLDSFKDKLFSVKTNLSLDPIEKLNKPDTCNLYVSLKSLEKEYDCQSLVFPLSRIIASSGIVDSNFFDDIESIVMTDYDYYNIVEDLKSLMSEKVVRFDVVNNKEYCSDPSPDIKLNKRRANIDISDFPDNYFPFVLNEQQYVICRDFLSVVSKIDSYWIVENRRYILLADFLIRISKRLPYPKYLAEEVVKFVSDLEFRDITDKFMYFIQVETIPYLVEKRYYDSYMDYAINYSKCDLIPL